MKTSTERALVQLIENILITACMAGLISIEPIIAQTGPIDGHVVTTTFGIAAAYSIAGSVVAYFRPPVLASLLEALFAQVEKRYGLTPLQNSPTMPVAQPMATGYPQVPMNASPVSTPIVVPNSGSVWAPLQGGDVSTMQTGVQPVVPKQ